MCPLVLSLRRDEIICIGRICRRNVVVMRMRTIIIVDAVIVCVVWHRELWARHKVI